MFDFVRKHTKVMMFVMFLLIIPSFVLFGIDGYNRSREKGQAVARVGGDEITRSEWDTVHKLESDRLRSSIPTLDAKLLDSPEARYATLERIVRERVLAQTADKLMLSTSDARLAQDLQENPTIASLRLPSGKLDMVKYRDLAASQGMTPEGFEARVRRDISVRRVEAGVTDTGFSSHALADISLDAFFEKREVQIANFFPADYAKKVSPTETEMEAFYKANQGYFQAPELANIEYVTLDLDSVKKGVVISEADLKSYFDQNTARLVGNEERRASHILINAAKDASPVERQKARAKAEDLVKQVRKSPETFAEIAKKESQDAGSAANGGDLDFFARGAMVKPFEDAAFLLKQGDISDVIESDFGYHIIKLTGIKVPKQRSFEELRAGIESDLKTQQAQRKFAETAEAFTNGVYEQSDSLKPIAEKLKLEVKTAINLTRKPGAGVTGVLANPKFLAVIFNPDATEKKRNTEAIETAPNQLAAARVIKYAPARTLPFEEVRNLVRDRVIAVRAAELAKKDALEKLAAWKASPGSAVVSTTQVISRENAQNIPAQVFSSAMRVDTSSLPAFSGVDLGPLGYVVLKVNKVLPRLASTEVTAPKDRNQVAKWWLGAETQAYYGLLEERVKAQIFVERTASARLDLQAAVEK